MSNYYFLICTSILNAWILLADADDVDGPVKHVFYLGKDKLNISVIGPSAGTGTPGRKEYLAEAMCA